MYYILHVLQYGAITTYRFIYNYIYIYAQYPLIETIVFCIYSNLPAVSDILSFGAIIKSSGFVRPTKVWDIDNRRFCPASAAYVYIDA